MIKSKVLNFWKAASELRKRLAGVEDIMTPAELQERVHNGNGNYQLPPPPRRHAIATPPSIVGFGVYHRGKY